MSTHEFLMLPVTRGEFYIGLCLLALTFSHLFERLRNIKTALDRKGDPDSG